MIMTWNRIIIHCSASEWGCVQEIRQWHLKRGFREVGYHFVILNGMLLPKYNLESLDGMINTGRSIMEEGAHCEGLNSNAIGICLVGNTVFTKLQHFSLSLLVNELRSRYRITLGNVLGHYETESGKKQGKTCPNFNMSKFREDLNNEEKEEE